MSNAERDAEDTFRLQAALATSEPHSWWTASEISKHAGIGLKRAKTLLQKLVDDGNVTTTYRGNSRRYRRANDRDRARSALYKETVQFMEMLAAALVERGFSHTDVKNMTMGTHYEVTPDEMAKLLGVGVPESWCVAERNLEEAES